MLFFNYLLLRSKFILCCLLSKNGSGPFKYLSSDSRPDVKLCQWRALETRFKRKEFSFLVCSLGGLLQCSWCLQHQCPAGPAVSSIPWLIPTGSCMMQSFCWDTSPWTVFPSTLKGRFPANSASVALQQFLCVSSVSILYIWMYPTWAGFQPSSWEPLPWASTQPLR